MADVKPNPASQAILWEDPVLRLIDQRKLPATVEYVECRTPEEVADAIRLMVVRGAPAIGATAAYGIAMGARQLLGASDAFFDDLDKLYQLMAGTRPTAVNLFWAIERMKNRAEAAKSQGKEAVVTALVEEAALIAQEDVEVNRRIGMYGAELIADGAGIMTHCNTGSLATVHYGTALGVIRAAHEQGKKIHVYATETRPFLQGARLTAWELVQEKIPATLITDNMAGYVMRQGWIDAVIVGADRVTRNGDVVNKIGTYQLAVLAKAHGIPFYAALPLSTIDLSLGSGAEVEIEQRDAKEVTHVLGARIAPEGIDVINPAFDVTPNEYVTGIITEKGVVTPPYEEGLRALFQ